MPARNCIVVGGGLCGLMFARAILEHTNYVVTLIESGDASSPNRRPAEWMMTLGGRDDWSFETQPCEGLAQRCIAWPRGRGMGGSSRINAMIWMPPQPEDVAMMRDAGVGDDRLRKAMRQVDAWVQPERPRFISDAVRRFLDANVDPSMHAFARSTREGQRWTPHDGLMHWLATHGRQSRRLEVVSATVDRLAIADDKVVSIEMHDQHQRRRQMSVDGESIVVSALGSIGSPVLCQRSGIPLRAIGENLHDHLIAPVVFQTNDSPMPSSPWSMRDLARYQHARTGAIASNLAEAGGITRNRQWQIHVTPTHYLKYPRRIDAAMTIGVNVTRPKSRGRIRVEGSSIQIEPKYLSESDDRASLREGVREVRRWTTNERLGISDRDELIPGTRRQTDDQLDAAIARYAQTLYHPGGTCAMGSVVDAFYRVNGMHNLHVVDASVLPAPTMANPSAMLATLAIDAAHAITQT